MPSDAGAGSRVREREGDVLDTPEAGPAAIQGGAVRVVGYVAGVLLSVGSAALLFRHLGVADAGRYVTALSLVTIAGGLSDLGLNAIAIRELTVRGAGERDRFTRALLGMRTVLTALGMVGILAFTVVAGYPREVVFGTGLAGLGLLILNVQGTLAAGLTVQLRLGWVTLADLLRQLVTTLGIVALVVAGAGLVPFLAMAIPASAAALALTAVLVRREMPLRPAFDRAEWVGLFREVLPYAAASMLGIIYFRVSIVLLSLVSTTEQTGYFSASFRVVEVLVVVPQLLVSGAFPIFARAARDDHERLAYGVQRVFEACLAGGVAFALALCLGAPVAIDVVAGSEFEPSIEILRVQALALLATFVNVAWVYALLSLRRYRAILWLSVLGVSLNVVGVMVFGTAHGALGAAWATAGVDLLQSALTGVALARVSGALRPRLDRVPRVALAAAAAAALALIPGIPVLVLVTAGLLVYAVLAVVLRAVPDELRVEARRALARVSAR